MSIRFYEQLRNIASTDGRQKLYDAAKDNLVFDDATSVGWTLHYLNSYTQGDILSEPKYQWSSLIKTAIDFNWIMQCASNEHHSIILNKTRDILAQLAISCGAIGLILCYFKDKDFDEILSVLQENIIQLIKTDDDYFFAERNFDKKQIEQFRTFINNIVPATPPASQEMTNETIVPQEKEPVFNNSFEMIIAQIEGAAKMQQDKREKQEDEPSLEHNKSSSSSLSFFDPDAIVIPVKDNNDTNTTGLQEAQLEYKVSHCCSIL